MLSDYIATFKNKFYIPLVIGAVFAVILAAESVINPPAFSLPEVGYIEKTYLVTSEQPLSGHFDFKLALLNSASVRDFFVQNKNNFDFPKLCRYWDIQSFNKREAWFLSKFDYLKAADNILIIKMNVSKKDEANSDYLRERGEEFFDAVAAHSFNYLEKYGVKATFTAVDKLVLLPENAAAPTESHFTLKYGVMGFAIGFLFGSLVLAIIALRGRKDD
ncbi:MAG: hypothetical protein IKN12_03475 [Selenomonadaceae bacterium]|nr:hypothetical protein [Selenomonadaceae bacterium]